MTGDELKERITQAFAAAKMTKDDRTTEALLLERIEQLEENYASILSTVDSRIVNALLNKQPQGRSPDVLLHKRLTEIAQENAPDAEGLIISALAVHFKDLANGVVYQHLNNVYRKLI